MKVNIVTADGNSESNFVKINIAMFIQPAFASSSQRKRSFIL